MTSGPEQEMHPCIHHPHRCLRMTLTTFLYFLYSLSPSWSSHKRPYEKLFKNIFLYTNWTPLISDCLGKNRLHLNSVDPLVHFLLNWFSSPTMKVLEDWTQVIPLGSKHFICWAILWPPPSLIPPPPFRWGLWMNSNSVTVQIYFPSSCKLRCSRSLWFNYV